MSLSEADVLLGAAVALFGEGQFLAAHEVLDDLWEETQGPEADFYKGLIQASVGLHHLGEGNAEGARKLERGTRRLLAPFLPHHRGLDLARFLDDLRDTVRAVPGAQLRLGPPDSSAPREGGPPSA